MNCILYTFLSCATEYNRQRIINNSEDYASAGKFERAYYEFESELDEHCEDIELHREFIRVASRIHRCEEAYRYYEGPKYKEGELKYIYHYANALLGVLCFNLDKLQVINDFEESLKLSPKNIEVRLRYAVVLTEYEMYKPALEQLKILSFTGTENPSVYSYIAICSANLNDAQATRDAVKKMLALNFTESDLRRANQAINMINSYCIDVPEEIKDDFKRLFDMIMVEDRPVQAREKVENLILKYKDVTALRLIKGLSLALTGEYSSALYELNSLGEGAQLCSYFQYASGIIYLGVQKEEKGIVLLEKSLELDPLFSSVYRILSELYFSKKDYEKVSSLLRIYIKLKPEDSKTRFMYGRALIKTGKIDEASMVFDYIVEKEPGNIFGITGKGLVERELARLSKDRKKRETHIKKSLEYLNYAIKKDPENENIKMLIKSISGEEE